MSNPTDPKQEQLLLDLYRRLEWNVLHADDEDFNPDEVKAIMQLLDVLDPIEEDEYFQPEPALARFKERYHIDNDTEVSAELAGDVTDGLGGNVKDAAKTDRNVVDIADRRATAHGKDESLTTKEAHNTSKRKGHFKVSSPLGRIAAAIAAVIVLSFGLNIGSYAVADKPFMEVVSDGMNSLRITTLGSTEEPSVIMREAPKYYYDSWEEAEETLEIDILIPEYIPEGYELEEIYSQEYDEYSFLSVRYSKDGFTHKLRFEIECYEVAFTERIYNVSEEWSFLSKNNGAFYYTFIDDNDIDYYKVLFQGKKENYEINTSESVTELEKIVANMR